MKIIKTLALYAATLTSISVLAAPVVIVNPNNQDTLTTHVVKSIFLGKRKELTPVIISTNDTAYVNFTSTVLGKNPSQLKSYWAQRIFTGKGQPPSEYDNAQSVLNYIANNEDAIAIIDDTQVNDSVKVALTL